MILVAGGTGTLGGRIVRDLLEQGESVRILVRDPSPSVDLAPMGMATAPDALVAAGADRVTGDLTDRASLDAACADIDTVITTATSAKRGGDLEAVDLQGTLHLMDAAREAGVTRFVYTSAYGAAPGHAMPMLDVKSRCEQALKESGLAWTILRPALLYEVLPRMVVGLPVRAQDPVSLIEDGSHRHSYVSEADVAAFAAAVVDHPDAVNECLEIGGPSYSWREIVDAAGRALGRELSVRFISPGSEVPHLDAGTSAWLSAFETYEDSIDMGDLPSRFGVELSSLDAVMAEMFGSD